MSEKNIILEQQMQILQITEVLNKVLGLFENEVIPLKKEVIKLKEENERINKILSSYGASKES